MTDRPPAEGCLDSGPMGQEVAAAAQDSAVVKAAVPRWAVHRRMYDWVLSLAHHKHSTTALFLLSFAESSFFPIPPDVLQIALTLERRSRAFYYAAVSTVGSVLGGVAGWLIGWGLWHAVSGFFFRFIPGVAPENFELVRSKFDQNAFLAIFTAAFTPIPYKVFTIASGVFEISLLTLIVGSLVGRAGRFFLVAAIFWLIGPPAKRFIERWFNLLTVVFTVLLIGSFLLLKVYADHGGTPPPPPESHPPSIQAPLPSPSGGRP
jgi:membrane protein YqaA with SNARE-associated domain